MSHLPTSKTRPRTSDWVTGQNNMDRRNTGKSLARHQSPFFNSLHLKKSPSPSLSLAGLRKSIGLAYLKTLVFVTL